MLPFDLLNLILSYLPTNKFFILCQHPICLDQRIWANRLLQDFGIESADPYDDYTELVQEQNQQLQHQLNFDRERVAQRIRKDCDAEIDRVRQQYGQKAEAALDVNGLIKENQLLRLLQLGRVPELTMVIAAPALKITNPNYKQRNKALELVLQNLGVPTGYVNYYSSILGAVLIKVDNLSDYNLLLNRVLYNRNKYKNVKVLYNY